MFIVKHRKIFYSISIILVVVSIIAMSIWGFKFGLDFTGGSSVEFKYSDARPSVETVKAKIDVLAFDPAIKGAYSLIPKSTDSFVLNLRTITEVERTSLTKVIASSSVGKVEIKKFNSVGPTVGTEVAKKSLVSIILVILFIVIYITFAFRKVSEPISSWKYGINSIIALCHDVIIPTGVIVTLGHFMFGFEIDTLFVTAILVILGFSIHDTIVVYDRVRENLRNNRAEKNPKPFDEVVGMSINQTFIRSINTSLTTLLAILVVYLVGPVATKNFALTLIIGIFFGTYSSIFIASNLLVTMEKWQKKTIK